MSRQLTFSIKEEDEWVYKELKARKGEISSIIVEAVKLYLGSTEEVTQENPSAGPPDWYVPGNDYSHLSVGVRESLRKWGYSGA